MSIQSNDGKWHNYKDGERLYADTKSPNLDSDLQKNIADELDSAFDKIIGRDTAFSTLNGAILGRNDFAFSVQGSTINVAAGRAYINGRRAYAQPFSQALGANVSYSICVKLSDSGYSNATKEWEANVILVTNVPVDSLRIGSVTTVASVITIVDERPIYTPTHTAGRTILDTTTPTDTAYSLHARLNMFANRIKSITGATTWLGTTTGSPTLKSLFDKFLGSNGHTHAGTDGNGPKISAENVTLASPNQATVELAINSLRTSKLDLTGGTISGDINLSRPPTADNHATRRIYVDNLHAAALAYTDSKVNKTMVTGKIMLGPGVSNLITYNSQETWKTITGTKEGVSGAIPITTKGGVIMFTADSPLRLRFSFSMSTSDGDGFLSYRIAFNLKRNGTNTNGGNNPELSGAYSRSAAHPDSPRIVDDPIYIPTMYDLVPLTSTAVTYLYYLEAYVHNVTYDNIAIYTPTISTSGGSWYALVNI